MVGGPVTAGDPPSIKAELDVQILKAYVMHHLIKGALQKSRIDRTDGRQSFG